MNGSVFVLWKRQPSDSPCPVTLSCRTEQHTTAKSTIVIDAQTVSPEGQKSCTVASLHGLLCSRQDLFYISGLWGRFFATKDAEQAANQWLKRYNLNNVHFWLLLRALHLIADGANGIENTSVRVVAPRVAIESTTAAPLVEDLEKLGFHKVPSLDDEFVSEGTPMIANAKILQTRIEQMLWPKSSLESGFGIV